MWRRQGQSPAVARRALARQRHRVAAAAGGASAALRRLGLRLQPAAIDENLGDLHRVERRALAQVVGDDRQVEAVLDRRVLADGGSRGGRVLARRLVRGDVAAGQSFDKSYSFILSSLH